MSRADILRVIASAVVLAGGLSESIVAVQTSRQVERSVTIAADQKQCALSASVQVWRFSNSREARFPGPSEAIVIAEPLAGLRGVVSAFVTFVDGQRVTESCRWTFNDLPDGEYVAFLLRPDGSGGSARFVLPNDQATIVVPPPQVVASGTVTRGGVPAGRVMFRIAPVRFSRPAIVVVTDPQGKFSVSLDVPGSYEASNSISPTTAPWVRQFSVQAGENQVMLEIPTN